MDMSTNKKTYIMRERGSEPLGFTEVTGPNMRPIQKTTYIDEDGNIIMDTDAMSKIYKYTYEEAQQMVGQYIRQANIEHLDDVYMLFSDVRTFQNAQYTSELAGKLEYIGKEEPDFFGEGWLRYYNIPDEWRK